MNDASAELPLEKKEARIHSLFVVSVVLKGLNAALEIILGILLFFTASIASAVLDLVQQELIEDPGDFLANHVQSILSIVPHSHFASFYLVSHGVIKLFLVWGLLRDKLWAYPASLVVFALFILYQLTRYTSTHSIALIVLTFFDLVVMWLIYHEWRQHIAHQKAGTLL